MVKLTPTIISVNAEWLKVDAWAMDWTERPDAKKTVDNFLAALIQELDYYLSDVPRVTTPSEGTHAKDAKSGRGEINLQLGKAGRPTDALYDEAYSRISKDEIEEDVSNGFVNRTKSRILTREYEIASRRQSKGGRQNSVKTFLDLFRRSRTL